MKCNELMVGDWIVDELGIPMQILSVCFDGAHTEFYKIEEKDYDWANFDDKYYKPYPILLTDEFFEKNDFDEDVLYWIKGGSIHDVDGKDGYLIAIRMYDPQTGPCANVHYVHELQQLLRLGGYTELANNVEIMTNND